MRAKLHGLGVIAAVCGAAVTGCTAILGLPDPTVDPTYGTDAYVPPPPDGALPDGAPTDGGQPDGASSDGGMDGAPPGDGGCACPMCMDGRCVPYVVASGQTDPNLIAAEGANVVFAAGATELRRLTGLGPDAGAVQIAMGENLIAGLHVAGGNVYFTNASISNTSRVSQCSVAQGCSTRLNYVSNSARTPSGITTDGTYVYFTYDETTPNGGLYRSPLGNASVMPLVQSAYAKRVVVDGSTIWWVAGLSSVQGVNSCGAPTCSGIQTPSNPGLVDFAVHQGNVYFTDGSSIARQMGMSATAVVGGQSQIKAVRVDATHLYWITSSALRRCALTSNCLLPQSIEGLVEGLLQPPTALALTADSAYFTTRGDGKVWRFVK